MKTTRFAPFAILALVMSFCDQPTSPPAGSFRYTSYDSTGIAIVNGWFTMNFKDSTIAGEWHFKPINNPQNIGPQTGDGNLVGGIRNGEIWIELNPQFRDNNLSLIGTLQGDRYSGQWAWISFIGITNQGTFEAIRK
jgi:hypothetical protein